MDKNRELHELLYPGKDCTYHPDYAADPRLVLREMVKREDRLEFIDSVGYCGCDPWTEKPNGDEMIQIEYSLDTTGLLRDAAISFLKGVGR